MTAKDEWMDEFIHRQRLALAYELFDVTPEDRRPRLDTSLVKRTPMQEEIATILDIYKDGQSEEERNVVQVLESLMDGTEVVTLEALVTRGGTSGVGWPMVAVVPATSSEVVFQARRHRDRDTRWRVEKLRDRQQFPAEKRVRMYSGSWELDLTDEEFYQFPRVEDPTIYSRGTGWNHHVRLATRRPLIPPRVKDAHDLSNKLVGFEVDKWEVLDNITETIPKLPLPRPKDPVLLEHLVGPLYKVVDQWKLSDVELAVLAALRKEA